MYQDIEKELEKFADDFGIDRKRSIGEVAEELGVETHVIRFWEEQFSQIKPEHGKGGRRYYYNKQLKVLKRIKKFLYEEDYTIAGLQKLLKKRKQDSYKEEDLNIIVENGDNIELDAKNHINFIVEDKLKEDKTIAQSLDNQECNEVPKANFIANMGKVSNINKGQEPLIGKDQRDELFSLFKNITKNLGDLKMLLRS